MASESGERRGPKPPTTTAGGAPPPPPAEQEHLPCPRCDSTHTKFCYYNNYNFSQPRHFCKSCRRYWTHGGTLRDIPVGGGSRKNPAKRPRTSSSSSSSAVSSSCHQPPALISSASVPFIGCEAMRQTSNNANVCGSFTSLLNNAAVHGPGSLALGGFGPGFEDVGFGLGRGVWPFPAVGNVADGVAGGSFEGNTWQMESGEGGFVGGGDCFSSWPELAISTPGSLLK